MVQLKLSKVDHSKVEIFKCVLGHNQENKSPNRGGSRVLQRYAPTYYLATYLLKTESKWKSLEPRGPYRRPLNPPLLKPK